MTETDIQRYAREIAAVDLTTFDPSHPTTTEYRLAHEVVRLRSAIEQVRALHYRVAIQGWKDSCGECSYADGTMSEYPCPTLRALDDQRSPFMNRERDTPTTPPHA